ncbi:MAG TPA: hypothetical protein PK720_01150 [bacterium]|nr:hypothetical protein [bacterium]
MQLIITIIITYFLTAIPAQAVNSQCIQAEINVYPTCNNINGGYIISSNQASDCGTSNNQRICCCPKDILTDIKPKYLIIASVTGFFAILTGLVFFYKKNE